jgi:hypothetical protein
MSNVTTITRKPTEQQAMLIKMATSKKGTTRAEVRDALEYDEGAAIPVQSMLKKLERFGYELQTTYGDGTDTRAATYRLVKPEPVAAKPARGTKKTAPRRGA